MIKALITILFLSLFTHQILGGILPDTLSTTDLSNIISSINDVRKSFCLPALKVSADLSNQANSKIKSCKIPRAKSGFLYYTPTDPKDMTFSQMIALGGPVSYWKSVSTYWQCTYDNCLAADRSTCDPYRQILNSQTTQIGCSAVKCQVGTNF